MEQKVRIFEAFAGYGSQSLALERLCENFPEFGYEVVGISEIDKYAVQAYNAIHGEIKNWGDVTAIDWHLVPDFDMLTWSSPCQDISNAGKGKGMTEGSGTRSSLLWEVKKPIEVKRPKYILFENVKNFIGENNRADALRLFSMLEGYGYTVFFKVMNAKDYGVPQNRERIFILAIDGDASYEFPQGFPLERRLKDVLEENVDERYYLSEKMISCFIKRTEVAKEKGNGFRFTPTNGNGIAKAITTCAGNRTDDNYIFEPQVLTPKRTEYGKSVRKEYENGQLNESRHKMTDLEPRTDGVSNTITTVQKDNLLCVPVAVIGSAQKNAYVGSADGPSPCINAACGMGGGQTPMVLMVAERLREMAAASRSEEVGITIDEDGNLRPHRLDRAKSGISEYQTERDTSTASTVIAARPNNVYGESTGFRIRKLTPRECLRLMDVDDADIDKMFGAGLSNTQLYKMAGNSIVVACLYWIFKNLFIGYEKTTLF